MKFILSLGIIFYTIVFFLIGACLIAIALNRLSPQDIYKLVEFMQLNLNSRIITGLIGALLIIINIGLGQLILGRIEKEKTIAFNTPTGQVTIALQAVEDLIKRLTQHFSEIKEMRPDVIASKRGVEVNLRVILQSEANIPDLTSHLQEMIKTRIQEMLGIEEQITVKVHIVKIITSEGKGKMPVSASEETIPPFSSYSK